jgi:membrane-bound lytic murein transglycosylase
MKKIIVICLLIVFVIVGCVSSSNYNTPVFDEKAVEQARRDLEAMEARKAEAEKDAATAAEAQKKQQEAEKLQREAEKAKPRFSPEGKEYVKKTLTQVAGEVDKSANRGKTLFFETSHVEMKEGVTTGQWLVNDINTKGITVMYYYGEKPSMLIYPTILYRVEISQIGFAKYTIDSFRETVANIWEVLSDNK